jgi:glutamate 5-kinase
MGVVPVVNENDTVAVDELKVGDNDTLGAMVASLIEADVFINLTDIDGLYDSNPRQNPKAKIIGEVDKVDQGVLELAGDDGGAWGTGGMRTKVRAAGRLSDRGIASLVVNGNARDSLIKVIEGENIGTFFKPAPHRLGARKHWLAFAARPKGRLFIDIGAAEALVERGKSLLPGGIKTIEGLFDVGDAVTVVLDGQADRQLGVGLVNYSAPEIKLIIGQPSSQIADILGYSHSDEVIHRDNLVVFD